MSEGISRFGRILFVSSLLSCAAGGYLVWSALQFFHSEFPEVSRLRRDYPIVQYQGKDQSPRIRFSRTRPFGWVGMPEVSHVAVGAIVVSEDWAFYQHHGYDPNQIKEALREDWQIGRYARGASTITQQVVRNVFLTKDKNLWRKLKEILLAVELENEVGKRKILETYLNVVEWGEGIYGIRAASEYYFHKEPLALTAREGAFLAMLLPSPKRYSQSFRSHRLTEYARATIDTILGKMTQAHYLSEDQREAEAATPFWFEALPSGEAL